MTIDFAPKLAKVMTDYSVDIKKGDQVYIMGGVNAAPLIEALYEAVLRRGGHPTPLVQLPNLGEIRMNASSDEQLSFVSPMSELMMETADVILSIESPHNTRTMTNVSAEKLAITQVAQGPLFKKMMERITDGSLRWCLMPWPTEALAQQTEMGLLGYTEFLYRACGLHHDDPVAYWQSVQDKQEKLAKYLSDKSHAEVKGPGIDLSFDFGGRAWISCHGNMNFPDGEIFTGPVEDSVNGWVHFNMRSVMRGQEVSGVKFRYENGVIVEASADKGEAFLMSQLDMDEGARRLGEFAIGTNWGVDRVTGSTLLDEKIGGSIHMAIGKSIPESLGVNESRVHWDMVHDMKDGGTITIDGVLFYDSGKFVVDL